MQTKIVPLPNTQKNRLILFSETPKDKKVLTLLKNQLETTGHHFGSVSYAGKVIELHLSICN